MFRGIYGSVFLLLFKDVFKDTKKYHKTCYLSTNNDFVNSN